MQVYITFCILKNKLLKNRQKQVISHYREELASVNKSSNTLYLSIFKLEIRLKCWLRVLAATGWQGATQGDVSPISSTRVIIKLDQSEDKVSFVGYNFSARSKRAANTDTPN